MFTTLDKVNQLIIHPPSQRPESAKSRQSSAKAQMLTIQDGDSTWKDNMNSSQESQQSSSEFGIL